jgi:hypothetical protein
LRLRVYPKNVELSRAKRSVAGAGLPGRPGHRCAGEFGQERDAGRAVSLQLSTTHRRGTSMQYLVRALLPQGGIERGARCPRIVGCGQRALSFLFTTPRVAVSHERIHTSRRSGSLEFFVFTTPHASFLPCPRTQTAGKDATALPIQPPPNIGACSCLARTK